MTLDVPTTTTPEQLLQQARSRGYRIWLDGERLRCLAPTHDELLIEPLRAQKQAIVEILRSELIQPCDRTRPLPLSFEEEGVWFVMQLEGSASAIYNLPVMLRIRGSLDEGRLSAAVSDLSIRHEALRTRMVTTGSETLRSIAREPIVLEATSFESVESNRREGEAMDYAMRCGSTALDLVSGPSFRAHLLRLDKDLHLLYLVTSHLLGDGESNDVLLRDLWALYEGKTLEPLPIQYADYAAWQRSFHSKERLESDTQRIIDRMRGVPPLDLPSRPRPRLRSFEGRTIKVEIDAQATAGVRALALACRVSEHVVLLAAWQLLLHRYSGQDDFGIVAPITKRDRPELESIVGLMVNAVPMRAILRGDPTVRDYLAQVQQQQLDAVELAHVPFDAIVRGLPESRDPSRAPLCQTSLTAHPPAPPTEPAGLHVSEQVSNLEISQYDCSVDIVDHGATMLIDLEYAAALFDASFMLQLARHYVRLLVEMRRRPSATLSQLSLLDDTELNQLLVEWNGPVKAFEAAATIHGNFERQTDRTPSEIAVRLENRALTYAELDARANALAEELRSLGARPGDHVALCLPRSPEVLIGMLGILKAGAAYVPIDTKVPPARRAKILERSKVRVAVTTSAIEHELEGVQSLAIDRFDKMRQERVESDCSARSLAYVLYTSGSTGEPKGVGIEHGGVVNYAFAMDDHAYRLAPGDRMLQFASIGFDVCAEEIYPCLFRGATVVMRTEDMLDADVFLENCRRWDITAINLPTAFWAQLLDRVTSEDQWPAKLRFIVIGGERALPEVVRRWAASPRRAKLINSYGATEATIVTSFCDPAEALREGMAEVPIGKPISNVRVYVLDRAMRPAPIGVNGELCIGGAGVARGYIEQDDLTAERFVPDPFGPPDARMYRTGDVARWLESGDLLYLGRSDHQVKVRGFRIELGEIESVLANHPTVSAVAVIAVEREAGDPVLVAYASGHDGAQPDARALRDHARDLLPDYMVPSFIIPLEKLPTNANGKLDRRALPPPVAVQEPEHATAPRSPLEEKISRIWCALLHIDAVATSDNFFELGGHSLMVMKVVAQIRKELGVSLSVRSFFDTPTIAEIAAKLSGAGETGPPPITAGPHGHLRRLSESQRAVFASCRPGTHLLKHGFNLRLRGALDTPALERAVKELQQRHDLLRTVFDRDDHKLAFRVGDPFPLEHIELAGPDRQNDLVALLREREERPIRYEPGEPTTYFLLIRLAPDDHVVAIFTHYMIFGGSSVNLALTDLVALYDAIASGRPLPVAPPIQYADYVDWRDRLVTTDTYKKQFAYWKDQLALAEPARLPFDHRDDTNIYMSGQPVVIANADRAELVAREARVSRVALYTALFGSLIHGVTKLQRDVCILQLYENRPPQAQRVLGHFMAHLPIRLRIDEGDTLLSLSRQAMTTLTKAYANADVSGPSVFGTESVFAHPLAAAVLNVQEAQSLVPIAGGLTLERVEVPVHMTRRSDFGCVVLETPRGPLTIFGGAERFFRPATLERVAEFFGKVASAALQEPNAPLDSVCAGW